MELRRTRRPGGRDEVSLSALVLGGACSDGGSAHLLEAIVGAEADGERNMHTALSPSSVWADRLVRADDVLETDLCAHDGQQQGRAGVGVRRSSLRGSTYRAGYLRVPLDVDHPRRF